MGDQVECPTCTGQQNHPSEKPSSMPAHQQTLALYKGECRESAQKVYSNILPFSWLGTRTLYDCTSFIWDSNYCMDIYYHLKHADQIHDYLWTAVTVVTYKKSYFLVRYGVNPQGSWTMGQDCAYGRSLRYALDRGWICTLCSLEPKGFSPPPFMQLIS